MCNKYPCPHGHSRARKLSLRFAADNLTERVLDRMDYLKVVKQNPELLQQEAQKVTTSTHPQQLSMPIVSGPSSPKAASTTQPSSNAARPSLHQLDVAKIPEPTLVSKPVAVYSGFKALVKAQSPASAKATFSANPIPSKRKNSMPKKMTAAAASTTPTSGKLSPKRMTSFVSKRVGTNPLKLVIKRCGPSSSGESLPPPGPAIVRVTPQQQSQTGPVTQLCNSRRNSSASAQPNILNQMWKKEAPTPFQSSFNPASSTPTTLSILPTTSVSPTFPIPVASQQDLPFEIKTEIKTEIKEEPDDFWPDLPANSSQVQLDEILRGDIKREMLSFEEQERLQMLMNNVAPVPPPCGCIQVGGREGSYGIYYNQLGYGRDLVQIR